VRSVETRSWYLYKIETNTGNFFHQGCASLRFGVFYEFEKLEFGAPRENFGAQPSSPL